MTNESTPRILVVDDEAQILRFLATSLGAHGYQVLEASTGKAGLVSAERDNPDLVILDLGLPDIDGVEILRQIRTTSQVPVLILSAREKESEKVRALDAGADDYITKPFGVAELMARVRSMLRRQSVDPATVDQYDHDGLTVDLDRRRITLDDEQVRLTPKEYDLLALLVRHAGRVVTHEFLLKEIWGPTYTSETHYLRVYVGQLRQKIERDSAQPTFVLTEPGVGYRLAEPDPEG